MTQGNPELLALLNHQENSKKEFELPPMLELGALPREEAIAALRKYRKGRQIAIHAGCWLPTTEGRGFDSMAIVPVSFDVAVKFINDLLKGPLGDKGAKIKITVASNLVFVG